MVVVIVTGSTGRAAAARRRAAATEEREAATAATRLAAGGGGGCRCLCLLLGARLHQMRWQLGVEVVGIICRVGRMTERSVEIGA